MSFGAVGTPLLVGVSSGINNEKDVTAAITPQTVEQYLSKSPATWGLLHALVSLIPLILCGMLTRLRRKALFPRRLESLEIRHFCRHCLHRALLLVARFLGPEFPSMVGGFIGLMLVVPQPSAAGLCRKKPLIFRLKIAGKAAGSAPSAVKPMTTTTPPTFSVFRAFTLCDCDWFADSHPRFKAP